ncbi:fibronectin type III domain-containing protein 7-like [Narcine bancroftii]|uniref:fibronectin type III domain-containing protein 7-like n=1 Tax=Narcine bancroftii TaxID=1343680 RepID=UPI003831AEFE
MLPAWQTSPGLVLLRKHVRSHKSNPLVERVYLLRTNPQYAYVAYPDGYEDTVSIRDLVPSGATETIFDHPAPLSPLTIHDALEPWQVTPAPTDAPCTPSNVHTQLDCDTNEANIIWDKDDGAINYIVSANGGDGTQTTCASVHTNCWLSDLKCGQMYTATIIASSYMCNSSRSTPVKIETAPCIPQSVNAQLDCGTKTASVSWYSSPGALSYIASATGTNGLSYSCNTQQTNCEIRELSCSQDYTVSVKALNENCESNQTMGLLVFTNTNSSTAECLPRNVTSTLNCENNVLEVSWSANAIAGLYVITAEGSDGHITSLSTTEISCQFQYLRCGQLYKIIIRAASNECKGSRGSHLWTETAPCVPSNVTASIDCKVNSAILSWSKSEGAASYIAKVINQSGKVYWCNTSTTYCETKILHCGHNYNVSVQAINVKCNSKQSDPFEIQSVPCTPQNVKVQLNCKENTALVLWDYSKGALWYTVFAEEADGNIMLCRTSETSCRTPSLLCGQLFSVYVVASDRTCNRSTSSVVKIQTAPCSPQNTSAHLDCDTHTTSVWWEQSDGAAFYTAIAEGMEGDRYSCNATEANCEIMGLPCGQMYNITVLAMDENYTSLPSPAFEIETVL